MATWQQQPPPMGFYAQQGPPGGQGYYPPQTGFPPQGGGYPTQGGGYPTQPNYGGPMPGGVPIGPPCGPYPDVAPRPPSPAYGASYSEDTLEGGDNFGFSSKTIRHGFIRKVYGILMCQLLVSLGFVVLFTFHEPTKLYVVKHPAMQIVAVITMFVTLIAMSCCESVRRKAPTNYVFLLLFTLAMSFCVGTTASRYDSDAVLMAVGIAAIVCFSLSVFAFQTKWDFTLLSGVLFVCLIVFVIFGIICIFIPGKIISLVYASLGVILFSFYLVYDTQLMMGGKHKYSVSPEEYIFAALSLYLDIINIFIYLLHIIGAARD